jgi:hypothetical protein
MSKYAITISEINLEVNPQTARGTIARGSEEVPFEAQVLMWAGTPRWKVVEEGGVAVAVEQSQFSQGERMAIARWLKSVAGNTELVGKSSQGGGGSTGSQAGSSKLKELEAQNAALQEQLNSMQALLQQLVEQGQEAPKKKPSKKK